MVIVDEAAETLAQCPRCRMKDDARPDTFCPLCEGSGMVDGKIAVSWNRNEARSAPPTE